MDGKFPTHGQEWKESWSRGNHVWNELTGAQRRLHDDVFENHRQWTSHVWWRMSGPKLEFCHQNGLLRRIIDADSIHVDECGGGWSRIDYFFKNKRDETSKVAFQTDISSELNMMINSFKFEAQAIIDEDACSSALNMWPQLAFYAWDTACAYAVTSVSKLRYVLLGDLSGDDTMGVIEDIWAHEPTLRAVAGVTPIATYAPPDDNFFALLGTNVGSLTSRLLQQYPTRFATRNSAGSVTKVKSIRDVRIAATTGAQNEPANNSDVVYDDFRFDMMFTLQDIDPP